MFISYYLSFHFLYIPKPEKVDQLIIVDALPVNSETLEGVPFLYAGFFDLLMKSIKQLSPETKVGQARKEVGAMLFDYLKVLFLSDCEICSLH